MSRSTPGRFLDDTHRGFFGGGVDFVVAELRVEVLAGLGLVVDQKGRLVIGSHPARHLVA